MSADFQAKLLTIWEKLNSELDIDFVLSTAMSLLEEEIGAERSSIWEIDRERGEVFFRIVRGEQTEKLKEIRLKIGEGVVGHTALTGKELIINNVEQSEIWTKRVDSVSSFKTRSILSVPLNYKGEIIGVIQLVNKKGKGFEKEDLKKVKMMTIPISTALINARMYEELKEVFFETAIALAEAVEKRDRYTAGHTRRVMKYSLLIADKLGLSREEKFWLSISAILHDIGKIGVPDSVLNKHARLDTEELNIMKKHPLFGFEIVSKVKGLAKVLDGITYHHEHVDGSGYPKGLKGEEIPLFARIIAVADTFDAMTTDRPYRKALDSKKAMEELEKFCGKQFDCNVVKAFKQVYLEKLKSENLNED